MSSSGEHFIDRTHVHALFDRNNAPAAVIESGDTVTFETLDACWGEVRSIEQFHRYRSNKTRVSNPITGPVFVRGARAGGGLVLDILRVELDETGFQLIGP